MLYVYHICLKADWLFAQKSGVYNGNSRDKQDGFIHMSLPQQVEQTACKYYKDQKNLLLLKMNRDHIAAYLKFEPNSKGELFPHYYGKLSLKDIETVMPFSVSDFDYKML